MPSTTEQKHSRAGRASKLGAPFRSLSSYAGRAETGHDFALFGERVLEADEMGARAADAGIIEGAGIALGLTALELIDDVDSL